jgi:FG-GAP-like repeat/Bacterial pre-peptidase C-terminal domain
MTTFSGSFNYSAHRLDLSDGDENDFIVATAGALNLALNIDAAGNITGTGTATTSASADAIGEHDAGEFDGFSHSGSNRPVSVSGSAGGLNLSWSFGTSGTAHFSGTLNAASNAISGTVTIADSGGDTSLSLAVPLTISGSTPTSLLQDLKTFLASEGNSGAFDTLASALTNLADDLTTDNEVVDSLHLGQQVVEALKSAGAAVPAFLRFLESPAFRATGTLSDVIATAATLADAGGHLLAGDFVGAGVAIETGITEFLMAESANAVTEIGFGLLALAPEFPILGGGYVAYGLQGQAKLILNSKQIDDSIRAFYTSHAQPQTLEASNAAGSAPSFQIHVDPNVPVNFFDPGFYLANHPDAAAAVANGKAPSALAYYLTTGIGRGDIPSAGASAVSPSAIPDLSVLQGNLTPFSSLYTGIFDLAAGAMPTDGLSLIETTVAQVAFAGHGIADTALTALANRLAIDLARNQHLSGTPENFGAGQVPAMLSNGATLADMQTAGAPGFGNFSYYAYSAAPDDTLDQIEAALYDSVIREGRAVTASTAFGIAEFGGVWVGILANANAGTQVHAAPSEASGGAPINFYGTNGDDVIALGAHTGTAYGGPGNDRLTGADHFAVFPAVAGIVKPATTANASFASAINLNNSFGQGSDPNVTNATTTPHATVKATASGSLEYYSFSVGAAGAKGTFDIDATSGFDSFVVLYDAANHQLASNDDGGTDPGSTTSLDSFLNYTFTQAGTYYLLVERLGGTAIPNGQSYTLNVSIDGAPVPAAAAENAATLIGGPGNDVFAFGSYALINAKAARPLFDEVKDYAQGNSGVYSATESDQIDLSTLLAAAFNQGSGQAVSSLVRAVASGADAKLQIDPDGAANGLSWTTIAKLDGLHAGNAINIILDPSQPAGTAITVSPATQQNDFNGDAKSDLLFVNNTSHGVAVWQMNGTQVVANPQVGTINAAAGWHYQDKGDFNGDGKTDLLLLNNTNHGVAIWQMNGTQIELSPQVGTINAAAGWHYQGLGDFNGDGKTDLLMLNDTTHGVAIWQMNGTQVAANPQVGVINAAAGWHFQDTGDFNGDGKTDLLMLNDITRGVAIWQMDGTQVTANPQVGTITSGWHFADTGDFNGDGKTDLLMLNDTTRGVAVWQMNGTQVAASPQIGTITSGWHFADTGDFNGDGKTDLLMLNDATHGVAIWQMNGTQVELNPQIGTINAAAGWHYDGLRDFNGDGKTDLLFENNTTHGVAVWLMDGTHIAASPQVGVINAAADWHLVV